MNEEIKCDVIGQMDNTIDHTLESANRVYSVNGIAPTCNTCGGGGRETKVLIRQATKEGFIEMEQGGVFDASFPQSSTGRGRVQNKGTVSPTITAQNNELYRYENEYRIRKLTPKECFRLMGVTDKDADKMLAVNSNSQCYKQAGNSIVVDVMCAMFRRLF